MEETFDRDYRNTCNIIVKEEKDGRGLFRVVASKGVKAGECLFVEKALVYSSSAYTQDVALDSPSLRNFLLFGSSESELKREMNFTGLINGFDQAVKEEEKKKKKKKAQPSRPRPLQVKNGMVAADPLGLFHSLEYNLLNYLQQTFEGETQQREFLSTWVGGASSTTATLQSLVTAVVVANSIPLTLGASNISYATGFFPNLMRINHSCEPNSFLIGHGRFQLLFALRDISPNEEITITYQSYVTIYPLDRRSELIQKQCAFRCLCSRCKREKKEKFSPFEIELYVSEFNAATFMHHFTFTRLPELRESGLNGIYVPDRVPVYKTMSTYLEQHGTNLTSLAALDNGKLRSFVLQLCVCLLSVPSDEIPDGWLDLFKRVQSLKKGSGTDWRTVPSLETIEKIAKVTTPKPNPPLSMFCYQQHASVFY